MKIHFAAGSETVHEHLQALNARLCSRVTAVAEAHIAQLQKQFEAESASIMKALTDRSNVAGTSKGLCELAVVTAAAWTCLFPQSSRN